MPNKNSVVLDPWLLLKSIDTFTTNDSIAGLQGYNLHVHPTCIVFSTACVSYHANSVLMTNVNVSVPHRRCNLPKCSFWSQTQNLTTVEPTNAHRNIELPDIVYKYHWLQQYLHIHKWVKWIAFLSAAEKQCLQVVPKPWFFVSKLTNKNKPIMK